jgi:hypothetical protein
MYLEMRIINRLLLTRHVMAGTYVDARLRSIGDGISTIHDTPK